MNKLSVSASKLAGSSPSTWDKGFLFASPSNLEAAFPAIGIGDRGTFWWTEKILLHKRTCHTLHISKHKKIKQTLKEKKKETHSFRVNSVIQNLPPSSTTCDVSYNRVTKCKHYGREEQNRHPPGLLQVKPVMPRWREGGCFGVELRSYSEKASFNWEK